MDDQVKADLTSLVTRVWKDVESLPWTDPGWISNEAAREQARQHFIKYTTEDLIAVIEAANQAKKGAK